MMSEVVTSEDVLVTETTEPTVEPPTTKTTAHTTESAATITTVTTADPPAIKTAETTAVPPTNKTSALTAAESPATKTTAPMVETPAAAAASPQLMSKTIVLTGFGGYNKLSIKLRPAPTQAGPEELLIRVRASGINFAELAIRQGVYVPLPKLPAVLGLEASGEVIDVGSAVTNFKVSST